MRSRPWRVWASRRSGWQGLLHLPLLLAFLIAGSLVRAEEPVIPAPKGYVSDYAGVVDAPTVRSLDALIEELKAKTGAEIAVVVVRTTQPLSIFDYAMKVAEQWHPGSKKIDNGVVFVAAIDDRQMFILTGYGVEGVLPDGRVGEIRDRLVRPAFRRGDYSGGIRAATREMAAIIAKETGVELSGAPRVQTRQQIQLTPRQMLLLIIAALVFMFIISRSGMLPLFLGGPGSYGRRRRWWFRRLWRRRFRWWRRRW